MKYRPCTVVVMSRDDALAWYGRIARVAVWNTPIHRTHGKDPEVVELLTRLNEITVGDSLLSALAAEGLMITRIPGHEKWADK